MTPSSAPAVDIIAARKAQGDRKQHKKKKQPVSIYDDVPVTGADIELADLILDGKKFDADITTAVTDADFERTMDGASTVNITVHDPEKILIKKKFFLYANRLEIDELGYKMIQVKKSENLYTMVFIDEASYWLRKYDDPLKAFRDKVTRQEFVKKMVDEVEEVKLRLISPQLHKERKIEKLDKDSRERLRKDKERRREKREKGFSKSAGLKVRGQSADDNQLRIGELALDQAAQDGAAFKAQVALIAAGMDESNMRNLDYGTGDSEGWLQLRVGLFGRALAKSITRSAHEFLTRPGGFTGSAPGNALQMAHTSLSAADIAAKVQGNRNGASDYVPFVDEAARWVRVYHGDDDGFGTDGGTESEVRIKRYAFRRGDPKATKREDKFESSWECMERLAEEVNWRRFTIGLKVYFISDRLLMNSESRAKIKEGENGVYSIDYDWDMTKKLATATVRCRLARWVVPPGAVVTVAEPGPAGEGEPSPEGKRWLVQDIRRSFFSPDATITLRRPEPALLEPAPEVVTINKESGDVQLQHGKVHGGTLRERIVAVAEASRESYNRNPGGWFYSQIGQVVNQNPMRHPKRGTRSDCSIWVEDVYKTAGAPKPAGNTWLGNTRTMMTTGHQVALGNLKPGDIVLYGSPGGYTHHVELFIGKGKTIGHGSPPVDYGTPLMMPGAFGWTYDFLDNKKYTEQS